MIVLNKLNYLCERITQDLVKFLIEDNPTLTLEEAMDIVYTSNTYKMLTNFSTHLYVESSSYVYEYLVEELEKRGKR